MFNAVAVVTNQVMSKPDAFFGMGIEAVGGHVLAHTSNTRLFLRRASSGPIRIARAPMQTLPVLYTFPAPPAELFVVLVAIFLIWAIVRVIKDARTWYQDEILDDHRTPAKSSAKSPREKRVVEDGPDEDRRVEVRTSNVPRRHNPKRP